MALFTFFKVSGDYLVGSWALAEDQHSRFGYYCGLYFAFTIATSLCVAARVATLQYFSWHGMKKMHEMMIERVLNAPINLYFDTTPIGRIINRFTKDLSLMETVIFYVYGTTLSTVYQLVAVMFMAVVVVPWIGLFFPIVAMVLYHFYKNAICAKKEVQRIESVTKSPLLSF